MSSFLLRLGQKRKSNKWYLDQMFNHIVRAISLKAEGRKEGKQRKKGKQLKDLFQFFIFLSNFYA